MASNMADDEPDGSSKRDEPDGSSKRDEPDGSSKRPFDVSSEDEADTNDPRHSKERPAKKQKQTNEPSEDEADTNDPRHSKERPAKKQKQTNERAIRGANGEDVSHLSKGSNGRAKIIVRRPCHIEAAPSVGNNGSSTIEETLMFAADIMQKHGVVVIQPELLGSTKCTEGMRDPRELIDACIDSPKLLQHLHDNGFENPEQCKAALRDTMQTNSNPVQAMTFSGSWWQIQTACAIGNKGFLGALQILLESGLHHYCIREIMNASRTIFTHEATIRGVAMQRENCHTDSATIRKLIYNAAWKMFAESMGWVHKTSLIPAGQLQMQVNMGAEVDPHCQNNFLVVDHEYEIPAELLTIKETEESMQPPANKGHKKSVSHYRKLSDVASKATRDHLELKAKHYYSAGGKGNGFMWTAMRPDDAEQISGIGLHGGFAPLGGKPPGPIQPRFGTVVGGQTLPICALLGNEKLLANVVRTVWELAHGCGGCHTFLEKANRPPGFANGFAAGKHKNIPKEDMARLRRLRVADATKPGPDGGFRHEKPMLLKEWSDKYTETVRTYIKHLEAPSSTPPAIMNALAHCIRSVEFETGACVNDR